jgi:hypothetical protein
MWPFWMGYSLPLSLAFQSTWLAFNCALWSSSMRWVCGPQRQLPVTPVDIERCGNIIYLPAAAPVVLRGEAKRRSRARAEVIDLPMRQRG